MKKLRKISREYYLRQIISCWMILSMSVVMPVQIAMGEVVMTSNPVGTITVSQLGGGTTQDMTATHGAIGNFSDFDIATTHTVTCVQGAPTNAAMFKVNGNGTEIYGTFSSDGRIYLIDPAGILIGGGATINVSQLVASSLDLSPEAFTEGLTSGSFLFTGGADADTVENQGTIYADAIALIGRTVLNTGSLNALNGYVVMAAGETVTISEVGSAVGVVVTVPVDWESGNENYFVDHGDSGSGGSIDAQHVILAAGDIWSSAYINTYSANNSDAVASVLIDAAGNVDIDDEIIAEAEATGGLDNAFATVTIDAGGEVRIDSLVKAEADAEDGAGNATATVDITAVGYVNIGDEADADVQADVWVVDSGDGTATVNITAGSYVDNYGYIKAEAEGNNSGNMSATVDIISTIVNESEGVYVYDGAEVLANAKAINGSGNATADVLLEATGGMVEVSDSVKANAEAESGSGNAAATVDISAVEYVDIDAVVKAEADAEDGAGNATATVDITADGSVIIHDIGANRSSGEYVVKADVWVDENSGDGEATVNITAGGDVDIYDDVAAEADTRDNSGNAISKAEINADGDVGINDGFKARSEAVDSGNATADTIITGENIDLDGWVVNRAITNNNTVNTGDAVGNIVITARGDLIAGGIKSKVASVQSGDATSDIKVSGVNIDIDGRILSRAMAGLNLIGGDGDTSGNSGDATAGVDIDASGIVTVNNSGIVKSHAEAGYNSGSADATTKIVGTDINLEGGGGGDDESVAAIADTYEKSGDAAANVEIEATTGNVLIDSGGYQVIAEATVDDPDTEYTGDATANLSITAGGNVDIYDHVRTYADVYNAGDATSGIVINAVGNVDIYDDVEAYSYAENGSGNSASSLDIDAGGNVYIHEHPDEETVKAKAETFDSGDATADIDIDAATGSVTIDHDVKAIAKAKDGSGDATSTLDITAGTDVTINDDVDSEAAARNGSGDATATIAVSAGGDIEFTGGESNGNFGAFASTEDGSGDAKAVYNINAGRDVLLDARIKSKVEAWNSGDATTQITITGRNITTNERIISRIVNGGSGDSTSTSTIDIIARGDVAINGGDDSYDYGVNNKIALDSSENGDGDATANTTITGQNITITDAAVVSRVNTSGDATANVNVEAAGNLDIITTSGYDYGAWVKSHASTEDSGNATASTTIKGADITITGHRSGDYDGSVIAKADTDESGNATADVTVTAANLTVINEGIIGADAEAEHDSGTAGATVTVVAANLTVTNGGEIKADAEAMYGSGNATADVGITLLESDVLVEDGGSILASADTGHGSGDATATTAIDAENVTVTNESKIAAYADADYGSGDAAATVDIDATGDVLVEDNSEMEADAETYKRSGDATAAVTVNAANVTVIYWGDIAAYAKTEDRSGDATATVDITTIGSDVTVGDGSAIYAEAEVITGEALLGELENGLETRDATAEVTILADGQLTVEEDGEIYSEASVEIDYPDVDGDGVPVMIPGDATANVTIFAFEGVTVEGSGGEGSPGEIWADAWIEYDHQGGGFKPFVVEGFRPDATANVDIQTCGNVIVDGLIGSYADIFDSGCESYPDELFGNTTADIIIKAFGDVIVNSGADEEEGSNGQIEALASNGVENSAGITVLAVGDVIVNNGSDHGQQRGYSNSREEISAKAHDGTKNNAFVHIATREGDDGDVIVGGQIGARTWDAQYIEVEGGEDILGENTSNVEICAARDVIVEGGYALYGQGDSLIESHEGGQIFAGAQGSGPQVRQGESLLSSNTAEVDIYAGRDVIVHGAELEYSEFIPNGGSPTQGNGGGFYDGGQIIALIMPTHRNNYSENTSHVGIYAQRDVTIDAATVTGDPMPPPQLSPSSSGQVIAGSHGNDSINDAEIEICAQDDVTIDGVVEATAGTGSGFESEHYAHIRIAAGDQLGGGSGGSIIADADPDAAVAEASVTFFVTGLGNLGFDGLAYFTTDRGHTQVDPEVVVGPVDCPDCDFEWIDWDWCEDCEDVPAPVAPLWQLEIPRIEGCPALTQAAAMELGITPETLQIGIGNALALNPSIQPCQACEGLVNAAGILRDMDGARMAAMVQAFNTLSPADAPFTPEMATSIAMAFQGAEEGSQYATAMEYIDAFVLYVAALDTGLGAPVGDSVAFVMQKYGAGVQGSGNANMAAFVATRLEAGNM